MSLLILVAASTPAEPDTPPKWWCRWRGTHPEIGFNNGDAQHFFWSSEIMEPKPNTSYEFELTGRTEGTLTLEFSATELKNSRQTVFVGEFRGADHGKQVGTFTLTTKLFNFLVLVIRDRNEDVIDEVWFRIASSFDQREE